MSARTDLAISDVFRIHPALETPRIRLRKVDPSDVHELFAYGSDPEVSRYVGWDTYRTIHDAEAYIAKMVAQYEAGELADWAIEHRGDATFIGTVGYLWWDTRGAAAEIGYVLAKPYWGRGIMTEVVREVMRFGWEAMGLNRIQGQVEPENVSSQRVLEKAGMQIEGRLRERVALEDGFADLLLYAALRRNRPGID